MALRLAQVSWTMGHCVIIIIVLVRIPAVHLQYEHMKMMRERVIKYFEKKSPPIRDCYRRMMKSPCVKYTLFPPEPGLDPRSVEPREMTKCCVYSYMKMCASGWVPKNCRSDIKAEEVAGPYIEFLEEKNCAAHYSPYTLGCWFQAVHPKSAHAVFGVTIVIIFAVTALGLYYLIHYMCDLSIDKPKEPYMHHEPIIPRRALDDYSPGRRSSAEARETLRGGLVRRSRGGARARMSMRGRRSTLGLRGTLLRGAPRLSRGGRGGRRGRPGRSGRGGRPRGRGTGVGKRAGRGGARRSSFSLVRILSSLKPKSARRGRKKRK